MVTVGTVSWRNGDLETQRIFTFHRTLGLTSIALGLFRDSVSNEEIVDFTVEETSLLGQKCLELFTLAHYGPTITHT